MTAGLRVSLVQADLAWEDRPANLQRLNAMISPLQGCTDLIVLPEMFTTGFSMSAERLAEPNSGATGVWMAGQAAKTGAVLAGTFIVSEGGRYYNRLLWARPDGTVSHYDKRHLFSLSGEHLHYCPGANRLLTELKGWKICPLICYDLRFPVWSRNTDAFDLLIYTANFPARRSYAWKQLLIARAIENQCYTIGVNRTGNDGNGIEYSGDSCVLDFEGHYLAQAPAGEHVVSCVLEAAPMQDFRKKFPFLNDMDDFVLK
ncbi:MAG: amidohydrolase [Saprospiraceae bacterium]